MNLDLGKFNWIFAKTYANFAPHEYIVLPKLNNEEKLEIKKFIKEIYNNGYVEKKWNKNWKYLDLDGYKYWCYAKPLSNGKVYYSEGKKDFIFTIDDYVDNHCTILNRAKL